MRRIRSWLMSGMAAMLAVGGVLLAAAPASADTTISSSGPLTQIGVGSDLSCSVNYSGDSFGEFYGGKACGTFLGVGGPVASGGTVYGENNLPAESGVGSTPFTPDSQTPVLGDGSTQNPYKVSTMVDVGQTGLRLTQTDTYVQGADEYKSTVLITNSSDSAQTVTLYHGADCFLGDDDRGYGYINTQTGGIFCTKNADNNPAGRVEGFIPIDGGSNYLETNFGSNWATIGSGSPLPNSCDCETFQDNGMSISWTITIAPGNGITRSWATDFSPVGNIRASSYVALGDSVAAGEGINENWHWTGNTWSQSQPYGWDTSSGQSNPDCHQSLDGYPHVLEGMLSANLLDLACTGAGTTNGILDQESGLTLAQLGTQGWANPNYDAVAPDVVSLTVGADDIDFADKVAACYKPVYLLQFHACGTAGDQAALDADLGDLRSNLASVLTEIRNRGVADGKIPIVALTEYYSPFPNSYPSDSSCIDVNPNRRAGITLTNGEMQYLRHGLAELNSTIADVGAQFPNVVVIPPPNFSDHRWCSSDPWVYGPSLETSWAGHFVNPAPFHPTPEGQQAIAQNIAQYLSDERHVDIGQNVPATFGGISLNFHTVLRAGTVFLTALSAILQGHEQTSLRAAHVAGRAAPLTNAASASGGDPSGLPPTSTFTPVAVYSAGSSAQYTDGLTVTLPSLGASNLYEVIGGAWQQIPTTTDGTNVTATLDTLGPLALGNPAPPVSAAFSLTGDSGQAPATVSFDASGSTVGSGSIASYSWDFGDGTSGSGAQANHRYDASGTYTVTLTVTSDVRAVDIARHTVTVLNSPPVAVVREPSAAVAGVAVGGFDASASHDPNGQVAEVDWDFGDGSDPVSGNSVTHTFAKPGAYSVTTVVWDEEGASDVKTATIVVSSSSSSTGGGGGGGGGKVLGTHTGFTAFVRMSSRLVLDRRGRLLVRLACAAHHERCKGTLAMTSNSGRKLRTLATTRFSLASGRSATLALKLPRSVVRSLRARPRKVSIRVALLHGKALALSVRPTIQHRTPRGRSRSGRRRQP